MDESLYRHPSPDDPQRSQRPPPPSWRAAFGALSRKNAALLRTSPRSLLLQVCTPLLVVGLLLALQGLADVVLLRSEPRPPSRSIGAVRRCADDIKNCVSVLYAPRGVAWVDALMAEVTTLLLALLPVLLLVLTRSLAIVCWTGGEEQRPELRRGRRRATTANGVDS